MIKETVFSQDFNSLPSEETTEEISKVRENHFLIVPQNSRVHPLVKSLFQRKKGRKIRALPKDFGSFDKRPNNFKHYFRVQGAFQFSASSGNASKGDSNWRKGSGSSGR